jgi:hypothetical protein
MVTHLIDHSKGHVSKNPMLLLEIMIYVTTNLQHYLMILQYQQYLTSLIVLTIIEQYISISIVVQ